MCELGGQKNLGTWGKLRSQLEEVYKDEDEYWSRKARVEWLQQEGRNTKYLHAVTRQRKMRNKIDRLVK